MPTQPHPKLPANDPDWYMGEIDDFIADFNGDGICDYVVKVPYPSNTQMPSYSLDEMMVLGTERGWKSVFNAKSSWNIYQELVQGSGDEGVLSDDVDLTVAELIYPSKGGAPYLVNAYFRGGASTNATFQCEGMPQEVYRWDDSIGTFRLDERAEAKAALKFYLAQPSKTCPLTRSGAESP